MKDLYWLGSSLEDLRDFPLEARQEAGTDLRLVQRGVEPRNWKPMPTVGRGVREIRVRIADGAYRVFYVVERRNAVFVLHAFQKKSRKTAKADIDLGKKRYKDLP